MYKWSHLAHDCTPKQRVLLVRLMEECAEIQQAAAKMLRFGPHSVNPVDRKHPGNSEQLRLEMNNCIECIREVCQLFEIDSPTGLIPPHDATPQT